MCVSACVCVFAVITTQGPGDSPCLGTMSKLSTRAAQHPQMHTIDIWPESWTSGVVALIHGPQPATDLQARTAVPWGARTHLRGCSWSDGSYDPPPFPHSPANKQCIMLYHHAEPVISEWWHQLELHNYCMFCCIGQHHQEFLLQKILASDFHSTYRGSFKPDFHWSVCESVSLCCVDRKKKIWTFVNLSECLHRLRQVCMMSVPPQRKFYAGVLFPETGNRCRFQNKNLHCTFKV